MLKFKDLIKGLPSEELLQNARGVLIELWRKSRIKKLSSLDSRIQRCLRELIKRVLQLESHEFDEEEVDGMIDGNSLN